MPRSKPLGSLSLDALLRLRDDVGAALSKRAREIKQQLQSLGASARGAGADVGDGRRSRRRGGPLKGRKVPPKYRGPGGETWAGRGARPRWLVDALKSGKKIDDFLIAKPAGRSGRKTAKRRKAKR